MSLKVGRHARAAFWQPFTLSRTLQNIMLCLYYSFGASLELATQAQTVVGYKSPLTAKNYISHLIPMRT